MKPLRVLLLAVLLPACATVGGLGGGGERERLWEQAHASYAADSVRVAVGLFQRLANEHPRSHEGHESRFYLAALSLDPLSGVDLRQAEQNLAIYLAEDSLRKYRGYHGREGRTLQRVVRQLLAPCEARAPGYQCGVQTRTVETPAEAQPPAPTGASPAEVARLRREVAERDNTIRELREELQRIRNTLAPPRRPR